MKVIQVGSLIAGWTTLVALIIVGFSLAVAKEGEETGRLTDGFLVPPSSGSDHVIVSEFDEWRVRHYFDQNTLVHRFSDAKTTLVLEDGTEIEFQINRRGGDGDVSVIIPGWYEAVTIETSGDSFQWGPSRMHTFWGDADAAFLSALAEAQQPVRIDLHYGKPAGISEVMRDLDMEPAGKISGTISHEGSAAALRWIRVWP